MQRLIDNIVKVFFSVSLISLSYSIVNGQGQSNDSINSYTSYDKFRFGGYGEILFQYMDYGPDRYNYPDGAQPDSGGRADIPRVVFSFDFRFLKDFVFSTEIEFEHGGTGSALELEYEEFGE